MRKLLQFVVFVFILWAIPGFAQTVHPEIPQSEIVAKAKPFVGNWQAVVCDSREEKPYGITFSIRVDTVQDPDTGIKTVKPIFKLTALQGADNLVPFDFSTLDFSEVVGDTPDKHFIWIDVENPNLVINLMPAAPNARKDFVVGLNGGVTVVNEDVMFSLFAQTATKTDNPWAYVSTLAQACSNANDSKGQNEVFLR